MAKYFNLSGYIYIYVYRVCIFKITNMLGVWNIEVIDYVKIKITEKIG
jgi:hypothetical protein